MSCSSTTVIFSSTTVSKRSGDSHRRRHHRRRRHRRRTTTSKPFSEGENTKAERVLNRGFHYPSDTQQPPLPSPSSSSGSLAPGGRRGGGSGGAGGPGPPDAVRSAAAPHRRYARVFAARRQAVVHLHLPRQHNNRSIYVRREAGVERWRGGRGGVLLNQSRGAMKSDSSQVTRKSRPLRNSRDKSAFVGGGFADKVRGWRGGAF